MPLTITITPKELERQAALAFEGKAFKVFLAYDPSQTLGMDSTLAECEALELAEANGYQAVTGTIGTGSYSETMNEYQLPFIEASFYGTGTGNTHDTVILSVDNHSHPHSIMRQAAEVLLQAGQSIGYRFRLVQDD
jgi:hypothetical protein